MRLKWNLKIDEFKVDKKFEFLISFSLFSTNDVTTLGSANVVVSPRL